MTARRLAGVIPAVPTPVDGDGAPDTTRFLAHARWALANGCDGLNVLGTTGEANSLSAGQRMAVMKAAAGGLGDAPLMVGTGTPDLPTTVELTRLAHELGYGGALVLPPWYYKNVTDDGLFAWFRQLVTATADRPIAIYFYNFPQMTGLTLSIDLMRRLKVTFPDRIAGVKDSSGDFDNCAQLTSIEDFDVFPGNEIALTTAGSERYAGTISATVNATAPLAGRFWADRGNAGLAENLVRTRKAITAFPTVPAVKYLIGRIQEDPGFERVLPPHVPLTAAQKAALDALDLG